MNIDEMMEISWRYTQCDLNLKEAAWLIEVKAGLDREIAESFLKGLTRDNVRSIDFANKDANH